MSQAVKIGDRLEDWEILDRRDVGSFPQGTLCWVLLPHPEFPTGFWRSMVLSSENMVMELPNWAPLPGGQYRFLTCPVFETLLAGGRGGGKSELLLMDFAREVGRGFGQNWRGIIFRLELGDLDEMVRRAEVLFKPLFPGFKFLQSKGDYAATWKTGEKLLFRHLLDESEYKEYHGHQYPWIGFNELTQWPDDKVYKMMFSCCRPTAPGVPTRVRADTNPLGVGSRWVKKRFRLPGHFGKILYSEEEEPRVAIDLPLDENFILLHTDPSYGKRITAAAGSKARAKAWRHGDWSVSEGGMFDDLWDEGTHVIKDIPAQYIPAGWHIFRSYDHGQSHPFCVHWIAESNGEPIKFASGRVVGNIRGDRIIIAEWYGADKSAENLGLRMSSHDIAKGINEIERLLGLQGRVLGGPADTEIWSKDARGTGKAPIDDFEAQHVYWDKADKSPGSRKRGWMLIRELLRGALPNEDGSRESPGLFITERCAAIREYLPDCPRSLKDQDEIPDKYEDHSLDCLRYALTWEFMGMSRRSF